MTLTVSVRVSFVMGKAPTPMDEEEYTRKKVERARRVEDAGGMTIARNLNLNAPPSMSPVDLVVMYQTQLPRCGDPTNTNDPSSNPRQRLPLEVHKEGTTMPPKYLEVYRKAVLENKNKKS